MAHVKIYQERHYSCDLTIGNQNLDHRDFVRLSLDRVEDLDHFLAISKSRAHHVMPMLFAETFAGPRGTRSESSYSALFDQHIDATNRLKEHGFERAVLAADNDGAWQQALSPRFSSESIEQRMQPLVRTYEALSSILEEVWVALTIEEHAPGGFDATDGLVVLQALEQAGLRHAIIACGTKDFLPLYNRRITQKKACAPTEFASREPSLASCLWAIQYTNLKIWSMVSIDDEGEALNIAQALGLCGIINPATKLIK